MADLIATNLEEELPAFMAFRPMYNQAFIDQLRLQIKDTENIPNQAQRKSPIEIAAIELRNIHLKEGLLLWQNLKRYIIGAYPKNILKPKREEAGQLIYKIAANNNWDQLRTLLSHGDTFIQNNLTDLLANGNMPPTFPTAYAQSAQIIKTKIKEFIDLRDNKPQLRGHKITANNNLFDLLTRITLDGQQIFRYHDDKRDQFVISRLLQIINGPGNSGIRGYIKNASDKNPIPQAKVSILNTEKSDTTNEKGRFKILTASETITLRIEAPDFQPRQETFNIPLGRITSKTFLILPI